MTEADRKMKKYTNSVKRKLNLPSNVKACVMSDFVSAIRSRREAGKTDEEIFAEFGAPSDVAAGLNEQMKEFAYIKSPWRWLCLTLAIICFAALLFRGGAGLAAFLMAGLLFDGNVGVIGGLDGPTQIFVAQSQESIVRGTVLAAILLVMSIAGFYYLGHMRKK